MAHRIQPGHAGQPQRDNADRGDGGVHQPQGLGGAGDARGDPVVLHGAGGLGLVQLHAAHAEQGQHRDRQHDDAQPAKPLQAAAPDIDGRRQMIQTGQHGGAGRREA